ncbi:hypothetical protein AN189_00270 [Loktanella sp. 3ANDIMAR09]|nr:hypothetical protein AN189_00270 [Loktanella sp. 3ANDIMAR09]
MDGGQNILAQGGPRRRTIGQHPQRTAHRWSVNIVLQPVVKRQVQIGQQQRLRLPHIRDRLEINPGLSARIEPEIPDDFLDQRLGALGWLARPVGMQIGLHRLDQQVGLKHRT